MPFPPFTSTDKRLHKMPKKPFKSVFSLIYRPLCTGLLSGSLLGLGACGPNIPGTPSGSTTPRASLSSVPSQVTAPPQSAAEKTSFALYMIGGDLEDDLAPRNGIADEKETGKASPLGAGSEDLKEILQAYQSLSENEKQYIDLWVGFGGARKQGWKGIKYADLPCLAQDAKDGYFGNDSCYAESHPSANLAAPETLEAFLKFVKTKSEGQGRKIVELWDHGLAYLGMGNDTHFGEDLISLDEMKQAFQAAELQVDLLGFDACLMGSLEVAAVAQPHAKYMVASEELEPGHGWNYTYLVQYLARQPKASTLDIGKQMVNSFIDSPAHKKTANKTLSVLDLSQLSPVINSLPDIAQLVTPQNFAPLLQAVEGSSRVGVQAKDKLAIGIDLGDFAKKVKQYNAQASTQNLQTQLQKLVVYSRHDGSKPGTQGLAVYSLAKKLKPAYNTNVATVKPWADFADQFFKVGSQDSKAPVIQASQAFQTQQAKQKYEDSCTLRGEEGHCYTIADNLGLASVQQIFSLVQKEGLVVDIGSDRLDPEKDGKTYFAPNWNGEWFRLCNGPCQNKSDGVTPSAFYEGETEEGKRLYISPALLNGQDIDLYLEIDKNHQIVSQWAVPLIKGPNGDLVPTRLQLEIKKGDTLTFLYSAYNEKTEAEFWQESEPLQLSQEPVWDYTEIPETLRYFVEAKDYQGNFTETPLYEVDALN